MQEGGIREEGVKDDSGSILGKWVGSGAIHRENTGERVSLAEKNRTLTKKCTKQPSISDLYNVSHILSHLILLGR